MDLKGIMSELGMNAFDAIALVLCFCTFVAILVWTWTRPRGEMDARAQLPVDDED